MGARMDMQGSKNLTSIGEVAELYSIKTYVIRYWEKHIDEIKPLRINKRRFYSSQQVALIGRIKELVIDSNYTLKGVSEQLSVTKNKTVPIAKHESYLLSCLKQLKADIDHAISCITV